VAADLEVERAPLSDLPVPEGGPGWLVTNPPYGRRVRAGRDRRDLYARLGQLARTRLPEWTVGLLTEDVALAGHSGLALQPAWQALNGGIPVRYLLHRPVEPAGAPAPVPGR
jgi:putative N6-adenine-specific DNA methylase